MPEQSEIRLMVNEIKEQIKALGKEVANKVGPFGEPKSPKEQMAAFKAMTGVDWERMVQERGWDKTSEFIKEMVKREAQSDAHRKPV